MTVKKIISGGQTGADRAALDYAIEYGIEHGGWVPEGRKAEDGIISKRYNVTELPGGDYAARTIKNVIEADGTLIVSHGNVTGGSLLTWKTAQKHGKPVLHIDMKKLIAFDAAIDVHEWTEMNNISILNVAGPRASKDPEIYQITRNVLETVFHIEIIASSMPGLTKQSNAGTFPCSVEEAVNYLMENLSSREKMRVASAKKESLKGFMELLKNQFNLESENQIHIDDSRIVTQSPDSTTGGKDASLLILRLLWEKLRQSGHLRVIK